MLSKSTPKMTAHNSRPERPAAEEKDEKLLFRIKTNDDYKAFEILFKRYYEYLCMQSFALSRCEQKSEEIVSELFYKIWKNRKDLTIAANLKYYLHRSARNRTIDHLRKYRHEKNFSDVTLPAYVARDPDPEHYTIGEDCRKHIKRAIGKLPPQARKVFLMSREEGKKYQEIAEELGLSIKTIETHMRRALIFLRKELKEDYNG